MSTTGGCVVIPFPTIQAPEETLDQEPHILDFSASNLNTGKDKMDKKLLAYYCIVVMMVIGVAVFLSLLWG